MEQNQIEQMGSGEALLCLVSEDFARSELAALLSGRYTLLLAPETTARELALAPRGGGEPLRILASGSRCMEALQIAHMLGEAAGPVVLLSPPAPGEAAGAEAPKFQTLAMFGTGGTPAPLPAAGAFKRAVSASHILYVFDAADLERERPQAVAEAALDFFARGEGFLVNNLDGRIFA